MPIAAVEGFGASAAAEIRIGGDPLLVVTAAPAAERHESGRAYSRSETEQQQQSSSSSIGEDSDRSGGGGDRGSEEEVQSAFKRGALDSFGGALEESLPMRCGISQYYRGKSKSFTSLADAASSSSARGLAKPENAFLRKRKNLLAYKIMWENPRLIDPPPPPTSSCGSLSKRHTGLGHRSPALTGGDIGPDSTNSSNSSSAEELNQARLLPPLHPLSKVPPSVAPPAPGKCSFATRSFSLMDLQGIRSSSNPSG